jgi:hypothetical protein
MAGRGIEVIRKLLIQSALLGVGFDCTPERHATLVFVLATGFDAGVVVLLRVIVVPRHILSPIACAGVQSARMA